MPFYRNREGGPNLLILHKSEWNRLKHQATPPVSPTEAPPKNAYIESMIEKSQAWIKTWPDTVQGCVANAETKREKQRAERIALVKAFARKKVSKKNTEAVQKAKQMIFEESCYGNKLLSALRESKALEERDAQIEFKNKIKSQEEVENKPTKVVTFCSFELDKDVDAKGDQQKCLTMQQAKQNLELIQKKKDEAAKIKEEEKQADLENAKLMKYILDKEQEAENKLKELEKEALDEYAAEHKKSKKERAMWEAEYYAKIEQCRKEQEELNCKIKQVLNKINKEAQNPAMTKELYDTFTKYQEEEKNRYEEFIAKSLQKGEIRAEKRDRRQKDKLKQDRDNNVAVAEINKTLAEYVRQMECANKCFCDRQCLIVKSEKERGTKGKETDTKVKPPPIFTPSNKLTRALKLREKAPTPWTGSGVCAAPAHFAQQANQILAECKYKIPARKVVDEFWRNNGFDATTLPIPNY
ncbi:unnamed protein product [Chrysodeixis includens]|uniref:Trichohyalin-plectin-homology domain-containing protein n=1 Tax=Chrysodeixis includens TaxID=689277 RepID=A0A9P0BNW1_CHRIL|nr:unnamed protein product [Chrysodeixis includens]